MSQFALSLLEKRTYYNETIHDVTQFCCLFTKFHFNKSKKREQMKIRDKKKLFFFSV